MVDRQRAWQANAAPFLVLTLVVSLLIGGAIWMWNHEGVRGSSLARYSTYRTDEGGALAAYELLRRLGIPTERWERSFRALDRRGVLFVLDPPAEDVFVDRGAILGEDIRVLDQWVRAGNAVVICSPWQNRFFEAYGITAPKAGRVYVPDLPAPTTAEPSQPSRLAVGVTKIDTQGDEALERGGAPPAADAPVGSRRMPIEPVASDAWLALFAKDRQSRAPSEQVLLARRGDGMVVVVRGAYALGNLGLLMNDNARFLANLAGLRGPGGTVFFDEYHQRAANRGFMVYMRENGMLPTILYLVLLAGMCAWAAGVRFGEPRPLVADPRRDSIEYVRALATLYQNAGMARDALASAYAEFRRRAATLLGLGNLRDLNEAATRYASRTGRPEAELRAAIAEAEAALQAEALSESEALGHCQRLTELEERLRRRAGRPAVRG